MMFGFGLIMQSKKNQSCQENSLGKLSKILDVLFRSKLFCGILRTVYG